MKLTSLLVPVLAVAPSFFAASSAFATPCGKFDFSAGIDCRIEVEGGCKADCTPLKFEAGCTGGCTAASSQTCVNDCGTQCVAQCDPAHLDCFAGCHAECDQPTTDECNAKQPGADCVNIAKAQCDMHCKDSCQVPPSTCQEHCTTCCTGGCTTQVNFDCDYQCFAKLQGGCDVQCQDPKGALFCNGQYVNATDVEQCIAYLATQGIKVDVSARGSLDCGLTGCKGSGSAVGCTAAPSSDRSLGATALGLSVMGLLVGLVAERRRRRASR